MKRNAGSLFIKIFVRSIFVVAFLLMVGVLSYKAAMLFWQPRVDREQSASAQENVQGLDTEASNTSVLKRDLADNSGGAAEDLTEEEDSTNSNDTTSEGGAADTAVTSKGSADFLADGVFTNLIYSYDKKNKIITDLVLEVLAADQNQLSFLTIPVRVQLTLSQALYKKINVDDPEIPQVLNLTSLTSYLKGERLYADDLAIVEELLGCQIDGYTAIPIDTFDEMFEDKLVKTMKDYDKMPMEVFRAEYRSQVCTITSADAYTDYLEETFPKVKTNFEQDTLAELAEDYQKVSLNDIKFCILPGKNLNHAYEIDEEKLQQLMSELGFQ